MTFSNKQKMKYLWINVRLHYHFAINIGLKISAYFTYQRDIAKKKKSHLSANISMTTNVLGIYANFAR